MAGSCIRCGHGDFILDRASGEMTCSSCGESNYVGSPESYKPPPNNDYHIDRSTSKPGKVNYQPNNLDPED